MFTYSSSSLDRPWNCSGDRAARLLLYMYLRNKVHQALGIIRVFNGGRYLLTLVVVGSTQLTAKLRGP